MQAIHAHLDGRARFAVAGASIAVAALLLALGVGAPASASGRATASGSATVNMKHFKYKPKTLRIAPGTRVVFSNTESGKTKHTATRAGSFDTGKIKPGFSVAIRFSAKGTYAYHCTIHKDMRGKIIVG